MPKPKLVRQEAVVIGREVAAARAAARLDQPGLAELVGVARGTIHNWERGNTEALVDPIHLLKTLLQASPRSRSIVLELLGLREADAGEPDPELATLLEQLRLAKQNDPDWAFTSQFLQRKLLPPATAPPEAARRRERRATRA